MARSEQVRGLCSSRSLQHKEEERSQSQISHSADGGIRARAERSPPRLQLQWEGGWHVVCSRHSFTAKTTCHRRTDRGNLRCMKCPRVDWTYLWSIVETGRHQAGEALNRTACTSFDRTQHRQRVTMGGIIGTRLPFVISSEPLFFSNSTAHKRRRLPANQES